MSVRGQSAYKNTYTEDGIQIKLIGIELIR